MKKFILYFLLFFLNLPTQAGEIFTVLQWNIWQEGTKVPGGYNVLKDNVWYGDFPREEGHINEWRMNLSSAGRLPEDVHEIWGSASIYCYLIVSDMDDRVILHDNGDELWKSANDGAALRLIYVGND